MHFNPSGMYGMTDRKWGNRPASGLTIPHVVWPTVAEWFIEHVNNDKSGR